MDHSSPDARRTMPPAEALLADLATWRAGLTGSRLTVEITLNELDALLDAAAERDALKREACAMPDDEDAATIELGDCRCAVVPILPDDKKPATETGDFEPSEDMRIDAIPPGGTYFDTRMKGGVKPYTATLSEELMSEPPTYFEIPEGYAVIGGEIVEIAEPEPYRCKHDPACRWGEHSVKCVETNERAGRGHA